VAVTEERLEIGGDARRALLLAALITVTVSTSSTSNL